MTINAANNNPRVEYTVGEGAEQKVFTIPFEFFEDPEVKLYVDGVLKTQGSGDGKYTVTGGEGSTGTATFNDVSSGTQPVTGISGGSTVIIVRDIPIERVTDFSAGADINRAALNTQLDTLTALVSDADTNITRSLAAPVTDANIDMSLPDKATRLGKALGFNSSTGNPEAVSFYDSAADVRAAVEAASDSNVFTDADHSKLDGIEDGAEVTSALKVQAAGALMDAELVSETHVKEINQSLKTSATPTFAAISSGGNISVAGLVDGRDVAADGLKLDGIEANATADQTAAEIRTLVESATDSNVFTDADHSKLNAIEANATADQTASEIKTAYESNSDTNAFTDADHSKLDGIAASANNYVHPNHSGEVTSTGDGATVIADNVVDEANLKVSNAPTDGYVLTARSGNTGGMTWEASSGGGSAMQTTGGTFTGDVTFEGAQYTNRNVVWDKSDSALEFADNAKIRLGQQSDLEIYHNALDSYIQANISGNLYLRNATDDFDVVIQSDSGSGGLSDYFRADGSTGEAKLFHYGSEKLKTQSGGVDITGDITVSGTVDGRDIATNIPSSLGTAGQVLTVNSGASAAEWADASGGGGASSIDDLSDAEWDGSNLSIGTNSFSSGTSHYRNVTIGWNTGNSSITTGDDNVLIGRNTGSYVTTGTANTAVGQNALQSTNLDKLTGSNNVGIGQTAGSAVTSGSGNTFVGSNTNGTGTVNYQTALGYNAKTAGAGATAINNSYASGSDSLAASIANNGSSYGATGANSVAIGKSAKAQGTESTALGPTTQAQNSYSVAIGYQANSSNDYGVAIGRQAAASGATSTVLGGYACTASGSYSTSVGGRSNVADGYGSRTGGYGASARGIRGKDAFASQRFSTSGDAQTATIVLKSDTTDATAEALTTNNSTASTDNQVVLPNNSVYGFTGTVIARENSAQTNDFAVWEIKGGAVRAGSASTTALGSYNINKISESTGAANWSIGLSADTTNGAVAITVTGEASHSIRWVATVNTTEVTY